MSVMQSIIGEELIVFQELVYNKNYDEELHGAVVRRKGGRDSEYRGSQIVRKEVKGSTNKSD